MSKLANAGATARRSALPIRKPYVKVHIKRAKKKRPEALYG